MATLSRVTDCTGVDGGLGQLIGLIRSAGVCALTGAGISTDSGIPDYRGPERRDRPATPMRFGEFIGSADARRRYWARSAIGWRVVERAEPNAGHRIVEALRESGLVTGLVTQNVDGLHRAAGSRDAVELHGALRRVICLDCGRGEPRTDYQARIVLQNPGWTDRAGDIAPDGDINLDDETAERFVVPSCRRCGGSMKPDVVFFGESVPKDRVARAFAHVDRSRSLLVLGSSLTVYSGYRFAEHAARMRKPIAIVNDGPTRADSIATIKVERRLGAVLTEIATEIGLTTRISG